MNGRGFLGIFVLFFVSFFSCAERTRDKNGVEFQRVDGPGGGVVEKQKYDGGRITWFLL